MSRLSNDVAYGEVGPGVFGRVLKRGYVRLYLSVAFFCGTNWSASICLFFIAPYDAVFVLFFALLVFSVKVFEFCDLC